MKNFLEKIKDVSVGTWIRTALLVLALVNQVLTVCGKSPLPIEDEQVKESISLIFTLVASVASWWKNNSFTSAAIVADEYLSDLRSEEETV